MVAAEAREVAGAASYAGSMPDAVRSVLLFVVAAICEIGGAWLVWQGYREHRGVAWIGAGIVALALYGFVATFQPDAELRSCPRRVRRRVRGRIAALGRGR